MASKTFLPLKIIGHTGSKHTGTVIFLHGSGDSGDGVCEWVNFLFPNFVFPHLKIIYPTAPLRPYTPLNGAESNVWFDRRAIHKNAPEDLKTIDETAQKISALIKKEVSSGIDLNRIIVGGFSMGGAMAFHVGYRFIPQLAGVFALASFINDKSVLFDQLSKVKSHKPPLFQWHGTRDDLVPIEWGEETFKALLNLNVIGEFHSQNSFHELKKECLVKLHAWILDRIPDNK